MFWLLPLGSQPLGEALWEVVKDTAQRAQGSFGQLGKSQKRIKSKGGADKGLAKTRSINIR